MLGRIMIGVAATGLLLLAAAGVQGTAGVTAEAGALLHVALALAGILALALAHGWIVYYLIGLGRAVADEGAAPSVRRAAAPLVLATAAALACFFLGVAAYGRFVAGSVHVGLFALTVGLELWALVASWRSLEATERALGRRRATEGAV